MDVKWQKNAHILIRSDSGYLKVDAKDSIRRTSFLGRIWFQITDWCLKGKKSQQLNAAVAKTLSAIQTELQELQQSLLEDPNHISVGNAIVIKPTRQKIAHLVESVILKGTGGMFLFGIPNYSYHSECLRDIPNAITAHAQIQSDLKNHQAIADIEQFFQFPFIQDEEVKKSIQKRIDAEADTWVG